jgi:hypothetical protein
MPIEPGLVVFDRRHGRLFSPSRLEEGLRSQGGESHPQNWVFLAMAHHQLGHDAEARGWLDRLRAYRPRENPDAFWTELEIRLLCSEVEALILYDPVFPAGPLAS